MSYEHCELHDEDATNGCDSCAADRFNRMSLSATVMERVDYHDPGRDTYYERMKRIAGALGVFDALWDEQREKLIERCEKLEVENTNLRLKVEHLEGMLSTGRMTTLNECNNCKCRLNLNRNPIRQVPCPECGKYTTVGHM